MKRLLLSILVVFTSLNATAYNFSAVAPSGQTLYYNIVDGHAEVVRPSSGSPYSAYVSGDLIIPASVTYNGTAYSVTVLSDSEGGTFRGCSGLISVTIPSSVTTMGNYTFYQCTSLEDVIFANGLQTIGNYAFQECNSLDSINLPNGLITIGNGAFRFCSNLNHVSLPNSLTTIGTNAFVQCNCKNIIIPDGVQSIGNWAFSNIRHIEYHGIASGAPWSAMSMNGFVDGNMIFEDNTKTRLITYIGDTCCVNIPLSVTSIGPQVFYGCSEIEQITIPSSVISIGRLAFHGCDSNMIIWMNPAQPPTIEPSSFSDNSLFNNSLFLIVPRESYNAYTVTNSPYWIARKYMDTSYVILHAGAYLSGDQSKGFTSMNDTVIFPDTISIISATPYYGYHFLKWSDNNTNNPRILSVSQDINLTAHFSDNYYNLSVNPNITTYGTCNGGGNYTYLSVRSFSANANYGYHFVQWNDGDTNNNRTITLTQDTIYTAIFAKNHYSVTGITTDSVKGFVSEGATVEYLDTVTLTATANYGYHFVRWNDNNTDNPRKIVATSNITKTAIFDYNQYTLNVQIDTSIHGTVNGTGNYNYLSERTINANANYGYHFTAWNDGDTSNPRVITMIQDTVFTAMFAKNQYTILGTVDDSIKGDVSGSSTVDYLDTVTLTATANYGYHFLKWSDNTIQNPRTIQVTGDATYTAVFANNMYYFSLYVDTVIHGEVDCSGNWGWYGDGYFGHYLDEINMFVTPNHGYHFSNWSDGDTNNPRVFILTQDTIFTAMFAPNQYTITGSSANETRGVVTGGCTVDYLDSVTITATANYGYHFTRWQDYNTNNPRRIQVTQNKTYTAYFDFNQYSITLGVDTNIHGTVNGGGNYNFLSNRTITATPNYGYHFTQWNDGDTNNPRVLTLTQDTAFTALFTKNTYTITAISNDTIRGVVTGSTLTEYLDSVTIVAIPNYGYHFTEWNDGDTTNPRTIETIKDSLFTAYFDYNQYSITLNVDTNIHGLVTGGGLYNFTSEQTITATPNYGYHFTQWNDGDTNNPRVLTLTQDTAFTALFTKNTYTITAISNDTIRGVVTGSTLTEYLDSVTIVAIPNYGYHFTEWNDGDTTNPRTIETIKDSLFTAYFDYNQYSITLNVDTNIHGLVTGGGLYNFTSEQTITATPNYGYHFTSWNDGDTTNPRTITLTQDTLFTALFAKNSYSVSVVSADTIWGNVTGNITTEYLNTVSIAATANYGYHFLHWNDGDTTNPRVITLTQDTLLTAYFAKNWYSVICISDNETMGYVTGSDTAEYLDSVSLLATSNYGYHFSSWNDGDTNNPRVVCLTQDTSFTALFAKNQYTLTVQSNDEIQGSVSDGGVFDYLDTATIVAAASEHYHFVRWNDGNTDNPREYVIVSDVTLTAIFAIDTHTVSVTTNDIARGMAEATGTEFSYGTPCTVTATAYTGYVFSRWSNGITANPYTFAVLDDVDLTAIFEEEGTQGISDVGNINGFNVYTRGRSIHINGIEGQHVSVYSVDGRIITTKNNATEQESIPVPSTGVYFIKVGEYPARRVVVVR